MTWVPNPKSLEVQYVQSQPSRIWRVGSYHLTHGPRFYAPSMTTWQQFLKVKLKTCVESWVDQKPRPKSNTCPRVGVH